MNPDLRPTTVSRLVKLHDSISYFTVKSRSMWTAIMRSTRKRRLRDPKNPDLALPMHGRDQINIQQKARIKKMVKLIEEWLKEFKKEHKIR